MQQYILFPLTKDDNGYSITDNSIKYMFGRMLEDNTLRYTFPDGAVITYEEFRDFVYGNVYKFFMVLDLETNNIAGFVYLDEIVDRHADLHFCFFKEYWGNGKSKELADIVQEKLFGYTDEAGKCLIRWLYGKIMKENVYANKFIESLKAEKIGELPDYMFNVYLKKFCNVVLYAKKNYNLKEENNGS